MDVQHQQNEMLLPDGYQLSVAVPLYNEETVVLEFHRRLKNVLDQLGGGPHEIVFVDDGSQDATRELLAGLAVADSRVKAIFLSRNFGHQSGSVPLWIM